MGEQPAKNEVERALASMSAGFHSGSDQIAAGVASLEEHLAQAPLDEQERVRAAIVQIVATQARLKGQVERLPQPSWDRFKAMVSVLKAQQTLLDEVGLLVKEHVLPRQMQSLAATPEPEPEPPPPAPVSLPAPTPVVARPPRRGRPVRADDDDEPRSVFSRMRVAPAFRGLVAMAVAGLALSLMPRDVKLVDLGARIIDLVGGETSPAPADDPAQSASTGAPTTPAPAVKRSEERAPTAPKVAVAADNPDPAPAPKQERPAAPQAVAAAAPAAKEAAPPAAPREEQFVPVVFTHQDYDTVMRALADLKQQYPAVLIGRKGEVQPVDLGKKGIWHRLVMLPAGPRPQAAKLCDQLAANGYDRCWVKAY